MKNVRFIVALALIAIFTERGCASGHASEADMIALKSAVEMYRMTTGSLPPCDSGLNALVSRPSSISATTPWKQIMSKLPEDQWGESYTLVLDRSLPGGFGIYSRGPDGVSHTVGNDPDDYNTWSPDSRGIETNVFKRMPWLWPGVGLSCILAFYLGVRAERYWNQAQQAAASDRDKPPV